MTPAQIANANEVAAWMIRQVPARRQRRVPYRLELILEKGEVSRARFGPVEKELVPHGQKSKGRQT